MEKIDFFFNPKSVAIIGASRDQQKIGHVIFRNFVEGNFKGKTFPINPKTRKLLDRKCYSSISKIKEKIDLAIISIPAEEVPKALEECGRKKIPAVVIISGGFAEIGNKELEEKARKIIKKHKMRAIGPNCLGIFDPLTGVDTIFLPRYKLERPKAGEIAFISQSGAVGSVVLDWMGRKGYSISKFVSYGNAIDVDEADLAEYLAHDHKTKVICAYFEGVREGRKFFEIAKKISKKKPFVVIKGGITEAGNKAVVSHTGSLAGSAKVYAAAFKQAGVIQAEDMEDLFNYARTLARQPVPRGDRIQIITDGGGFGVLLADHIIENGLKLAEMSKENIEELRKQFPNYVILKNPMDLTGDTDAKRYELALDAAMKDPNVDMIGLIVLLQVPRLSADVVETIINAYKKMEKPIFVISAGGEFTEVLKKSLEEFGVPTFSYPQSAAKAMRILCQFGKNEKE